MLFCATGMQEVWTEQKEHDLEDLSPAPTVGIWCAIVTFQECDIHAPNPWPAILDWSKLPRRLTTGTDTIIWPHILPPFPLFFSLAYSGNLPWDRSPTSFTRIGHQPMPLFVGIFHNLQCKVLRITSVKLTFYSHSLHHLSVRPQSTLKKS